MSKLNSYLITDPKYYGNTPEKLYKNLSLHVKDKNIDYICFRDKTTQDIEPLIKSFTEFAKANNIVHVMINSYIDLAYKYGAFGVHLTSSQFSEIKRAKNLGLHVIISTHTKDEITRAETLGADAVTFSPIFDTPNKGEAKGIDVLADMCAASDMKIIALGGIVSDVHVEKLKNSGCFGFASIRYFLK